MRLLKADNTTIDMNIIPDKIEDLSFCILDYSNQANIDYYFYPLIYMETFYADALSIRIGKHIIQMPLSWSIVIGDKNTGEMEILEFKDIRSRPLNAFTFNPLSDFMPSFPDIEVVDYFSDIKFYFPKLKTGHLLAVPLYDRYVSKKDEKGPPCALFVRETNKLPDVLDITKIL